MATEEKTDTHNTRIAAAAAPAMRPKARGKSIPDASEARAQAQPSPRRTTSQMPTSPPVGSPSAAEMDAWPTEVLAGDKLPDFKTDTAQNGVFARSPWGPDDAGAPRATQALSVVLWRDAAGVHVAPSGGPARSGALLAVVVASDPDVDLADFLRAK